MFLALALLVLVPACGALRIDAVTRATAMLPIVRRLMPPWLYDASSSTDSVSAEWRAASAALHSVEPPEDGEDSCILDPRIHCDESTVACAGFESRLDPMVERR
jgi:hypothetical protein